MSSGRFLLVSTIKNEAPNILEWVAHHRLCGFDPIIICQNASTDLTARTLRVLDRMGAIRFINNEVYRGAPQPAAYRKASRSAAFEAAEYCLALDGDEFFRCDLPTRSVAELVETTDRPDQIHLNWQNFGSNGERELSDRLVTERFTTSGDPATITSRKQGFKTLFRTDAFARIGIHRPRFPKRDGLRNVNGSGLGDDRFSCLGWQSDDPSGMRYARVHHYPIRDVVSFVLKQARGSAHQDYRNVGLRYWNRFDTSEAVDTTLADRAPALLAEMARLDEQSGGRLLFMREKSLRQWRRSFKAMREDPDVAGLVAELTETRVPAPAPE